MRVCPGFCFAPAVITTTCEPSTTEMSLPPMMSLEPVNWRAVREVEHLGLDLLGRDVVQRDVPCRPADERGVGDAGSDGSRADDGDFRVLDDSHGLQPGSGRMPEARRVSARGRTMTTQGRGDRPCAAGWPTPESRCSPPRSSSTRSTRSSRCRGTRRSEPRPSTATASASAGTRKTAVPAAIPSLFRSIEPAWNDENLREISHAVRSPLFFTHVRAAGGPPIQQTNCHPFRYDNWLFMHNGVISQFGLDQARPDVRRRSVAVPAHPRHHRLRGALPPRAHLRAGRRSDPGDGGRDPQGRGGRAQGRRAVPDAGDHRRLGRRDPVGVPLLVAGAVADALPLRRHPDAARDVPRRRSARRPSATTRRSSSRSRSTTCPEPSSRCRSRPSRSSTRRAIGTSRSSRREPAAAGDVERMPRTRPSASERP